MTEYKEAQITKHALMYYLQKPDMSEKDRNTVQFLLDQKIARVKELKERYRIK